MATLTNTAGAVVTVPDTEVDFYRQSGWFIPGSTTAEVKPPRKRSPRKKTAAKKPVSFEKPSEGSDGDEP